MIPLPGQQSQSPSSHGCFSDLTDGGRSETIPDYYYSCPIFTAGFREMSNVPSSSDDSASDSDSLINRTLGDFRLLRLLGTGGMAEVYLAEQVSLKRSVAVKILTGDYLDGKNDTLLKRFEQEARAAGGLSDPNIVQVYMIGSDDGLHYIVQEYVQGQNLSQWFKRNGPPDFLTGLKWMKQVAAALKTASESGVVHRDIKPENIMLTRSEDAKVTDFGLAQLNEPTQKMNLTQAGTTMGTPWYMSPEQIQGEPLDYRTDQYAFGVTCYHMFAGEPPFAGKNSVSVAVQHLKDEPAPLNSQRRDLPEAMCRVIHRMMSKRPDDRFASPDALQKALDELDKEPARNEFVDTSSFSGWVRSSLPSFRMLATGLVVCCLLGAAVGNRLLRPVKLIVKESGFRQEPTAARQYATALMNPQNEAAWRAVFEFYSDSEEALWARLQLACYQLTRTTPNPSKGLKQFQDLAQDASTEPEDRKRGMQFLATLGEALAVQQQLGSLSDLAVEAPVSDDQQRKMEALESRFQGIVDSTLMDEYLPEMQLGKTNATINAPSVLREFYQTLREDLGT